MRPQVVLAHTSKLALLARKRAGRLRIGPVSVTAMGELLTEKNRTAISEGFGMPLVNQFTSDGELDRSALASSLERSLLAAGLPRPRVRVREARDIARHPETGKARRFIPL